MPVYRTDQAQYMCMFRCVSLLRESQQDLCMMHPHMQLHNLFLGTFCMAEACALCLLHSVTGLGISAEVPMQVSLQQSMFLCSTAWQL